MNKNTPESETLKTVGLIDFIKLVFSNPFNFMFVSSLFSISGSITYFLAANSSRIHDATDVFIVFYGMSMFVLTIAYRIICRYKGNK